MNYGILDFLSLIGALGFFIYGMKIMSDGVQKVAGSRLRQILASMTSNRVFGVLTGFLITCLIQSSSATTVMVVSFVNAGLLSLTESIGVIMGANIGTTITAWLISIFGFKVKIADFSLLIIGISFPMLFLKNNNLKNLGETLIGFALLFMGLEALKENVPDLQSNPEALEFLKGFSYEDKSYFGKLITTIFFVFIGTLITIVVQSSSAAMALTLVMTNQGWIPFPLAASMVLGENIGTTITANLAALVANYNAKRAARAHFIFNVFGVVWMVLLMPFFLNGIDAFMSESDMGSPMTTASSVPIGLSIFHTVFNITNVLLLIWFTNFIAATVKKLVKEKKPKKKLDLPVHLNDEDLNDFEAALKNCRKELVEMSNLCDASIKNLRQYLSDAEPVAGKLPKIRKTIRKAEEKSNEFDKLISGYLIKLNGNHRTRKDNQRVIKLTEISSELEDLCDLNEAMASELEINRQKHIYLSQKQINNLDELLRYLENSFLDIKKFIENDFSEGELHRLHQEDYLDNTFDRIKDDLLKMRLSGTEQFEQSLFYSRLLSFTEQIYFRIKNIRKISQREIK